MNAPFDETSKDGNDDSFWRSYVAQHRSSSTFVETKFDAAAGVFNSKVATTFPQLGGLVYTGFLVLVLILFPLSLGGVFACPNLTNGLASSYGTFAEHFISSTHDFIFGWHWHRTHLGALLGL